MGIILKAILTALLVVISSQTQASEVITKSELDLGRKSYAAFECAISAGMAKMSDENERLFLLGLNNGKKFFESTNFKEPDSSLVNDNISFVLVTLDAPNTDFFMGRLYQTAYEGVFQEVAELTNLENQRTRAEKYFKDKNCSLIK